MKLFMLLSEMKKFDISSLLQELTLTEFTTLHVLKRSRQMDPDKEITVSELGQYTHATLPAVSRTLKQLQEKQWITREMGGNDRRSVSVTLTEEGERILLLEEQGLKQYIQELEKQMGKEELLTFSKQLERFLVLCEDVKETKIQKK